MAAIKILWKSADNPRYFLIPNSEELPVGDYQLIDMDGNELSTNLQSILVFETLEAIAEAHLRKTYRDALNETKAALVRMQKFAQYTGKFDAKSMEKMLQNAFKELKSEEQGPFTMGKEIVDDILGSVKRPGSSEEEQQEDFKRILSKVPDMMKFFEPSALEKAMQDPEAWAKAMNEKMFGEQLDAKKKANHERLKKEVQESIERGMRNAGIEPAPRKSDDDSKA